MKAAVVVFPGSNCDRDCKVAIERSAGARVEMVWHQETALPDDLDLIVLPGGFSYGDYLRCGAMAAQSPVMKEVVTAANNGVAVVGICNGFQVLCEAGLLPGALQKNAGLKFICRTVDLRVETTSTALTNTLTAGSTLRIPINHFEGNYTCAPETLARLRDEDRIVVRYVDNPNGSTDAIAGVCNEGRNVVGLMPHPERAIESVLGSADGAGMIASIVAAAGAGVAR